MTSPEGFNTENGLNNGTDQVLTIANLNPRVIKIKDGFSGLIVTKAVQLEKELTESNLSRSYNKIVKTNMGNPQAVGQKPITYIRQVIAMVTYPDLINSCAFPEDTKYRARRLLAGCDGGSIGSYDDGQGIAVIRHDIANYIAERDGVSASQENVYVCGGATEGIRSILTLLMNGKHGKEITGIMIPVSQYPCYFAFLAEYDAYPIPYYLNEDNNWELEITDLKRAVDEARPNCNPRAIVVINPGNPTGQVLTQENIQNIIKFAKEEKLFMMADEVYQHNIYDPSCRFYSFKKVLKEMGDGYSHLQLASFMSASKGYMGECGYRGGYTEVINLDPDVALQYHKYISISLSPPVSGQAVMDCIVNPPKPGEPSYDLFIKERSSVIMSLAKKAEYVTAAFNAIEGIKCNAVQGAMYAFPRVFLPLKAVEEAKKTGQSPDLFYCLQMLEETGIWTVSGSELGEKAETYHFRITLLPPIDELQSALERFKEFHIRFLGKYK